MQVEPLEVGVEGTVARRGTGEHRVAEASDEPAGFGADGADATNRSLLQMHNFIEFIASGRATPSLADALSQAEEQVKTLSADVASLEQAKDHAFTPPPKAWIEDRVTELTDLLEHRTERSALAFRRLAGPVTLTPKKPDVGEAYYHASPRLRGCGRGFEFIAVVDLSGIEPLTS